jgi:hypothetical protein
MRRNVRRMFIILISVITISSLSLLYTRYWALQRLGHGLYGRSISVNSTCHIDHHLHLHSLLPRRTGNFYTGSETCALQRRFASIVNHTLYVDCMGSGMRAMYQLNPEWLTARNVKILAETTNLMKRTVDQPPPISHSNTAIHVPIMSLPLEPIEPPPYIPPPPPTLHDPKKQLDAANDAQTKRINHQRGARWRAASRQHRHNQWYRYKTPVPLDALDTSVRVICEHGPPVTGGATAVKASIAVTKEENFILHHTPLHSVRQRAHMIVNAINNATTSVVPPSLPLATATTNNQRSAQPRPPNIEMIMIDAMSREHFMRSMPATVSFMEKLSTPSSSSSSSPSSSKSGSSSSSSSSTGYTAFEFLRYHIVGFSTRGNLLPMLCGVDGTPKSNQQCPAANLIWNQYRQYGYATSYLLNQCSDYFQDYFTPESPLPDGVAVDHEIVTPFCHPEYDHAGEWSNFYGPYAVRRRCMAGKYVHEYTLEHIWQFHDSYRSIPRARVNSDSNNDNNNGVADDHDDNDNGDDDGVSTFGFSGFAEAHEGSLEVAATLDYDLAAFLRAFTNQFDDHSFVLPSPIHLPSSSSSSSSSMSSLSFASSRRVAQSPPQWRQYMYTHRYKQSPKQSPSSTSDRMKRTTSFPRFNPSSLHGNNNNNNNNNNAHQQHSSKRSNETILFVLSDHGSHMGPFYEFSRAGRQEHRLPFLFVLVPNSLLTRRPELRQTLLHNRDALVTPYDIYHTLRHLLVYEQSSSDSSFDNEWSSHSNSNGNSLHGSTIADVAIMAPSNRRYESHSRSLLQPIPLTRTCDDANIPANLCACRTSSPPTPMP